MSNNNQKKSNGEYNYKLTVYSITAKSNLHVGSGSENYGVIDNLIQRDATTGLPCIHSSSLKGALKEFCRNYVTGDKNLINYVFGNDKDEDENSGSESKHKAGKCRFFQANLLSLPVRSNERAFYRVTAPILIEQLNETLGLFGAQLNEKEALIELSNILKKSENQRVIFDEKDAYLESNDLKAKKVAAPKGLKNAEKILGSNIAVVNDTDFIELASDYHLPTIARNYLVNGESNNLWYEQVLPRETKLFFCVLYPDMDLEEEKNKCHSCNFNKLITRNPVQIGANASVGYGFCQIEEIDTIALNSKK